MSSSCIWRSHALLHSHNNIHLLGIPLKFVDGIHAVEDNLSSGASHQGVFQMKKAIVFLTLLLAAGMLFAAGGGISR